MSGLQYICFHCSYTVWPHRACSLCIKALLIRLKIHIFWVRHTWNGIYNIWLRQCFSEPIFFNFSTFIELKISRQGHDWMDWLQGCQFLLKDTMSKGLRSGREWKALRGWVGRQNSRNEHKEVKWRQRNKHNVNMLLRHRDGERIRNQSDNTTGCAHCCEELTQNDKPKSNAAHKNTVLFLPLVSWIN